MWHNSKDWKTGFLIKTDLLESISKRREAPAISGLQLKIENQIKTYHWTFGKDSLILEKILWAIHN